jgi:hypothetical protein
VPAEAVVQAFDSAVPAQVPADLSARQQFLWQRGRYLYRAAGCVLCHGPSAGGAVKLNSLNIGTVWSSNLAGIDEVALRRALTSGVTSAGHRMDQGATLWINHTHLTEEDRHALWLFLRSLPRGSAKVPPPAAPTKIDCRPLTLWLASSSTTPGCSK